MKKLLVLFVVLMIAVGALFFIGNSQRVSVSLSRDLDYTPAQVWKALGETWAWTRWWPELKQSELNSPLQPGAQLVLVFEGDKANQAPAEILVARAAKELAWKKPGLLGSKTVTSFRLQRAATGTVLTMECTVEGMDAMLIQVFHEGELNSRMSNVLDALAGYLGQQAERRAGAQ